MQHFSVNAVTTQTETVKTSGRITHLCLWITLLLLTKISIAQIGIKGGVGASDIVFADEGQTPYLGYEVDYLTHNYPLFSYQFGVFGTIPFHKHFDFQPELMFSRQGLNYNISFLYDNITYRLHIYYLQMPLLIRYKMALRKKSHPILFLGPYGSIKLVATRITEFDGDRIEENMENVKTTDFGLTFGFGYDFELPKGEIVIDLRCNYGLIDMMEYTDGHIPDYDGPAKERAQNVSILVMFGYRFSNISKKEER